MNSCLTCDKSDAWHARAADHIMDTVGPMAVLEFESEHPTRDEDE